MSLFKTDLLGGRQAVSLVIPDLLGGRQAVGYKRPLVHWSGQVGAMDQKESKVS